MKKNNKNVKQQKPSNKRKKCRVCPGIHFASETEYLLHIKDQHKGKMIDCYMCSDCGRQFKTRSELTHHINSKCGTVKRYKCSVCNQELMTAGSLHNHMLRHVGVCSFMCRFCAKLFLTAGQLKVHERIHTLDKAFVCDVCGKGFCHRQSLITHSTLHTGIKPYQCENCGNSFSCVGNLMKHRRTHSDTCGLIPLTTHTVQNPATRMKVKINTPANSRLKKLEKEKQLQQKLAALETSKEFIKAEKTTSTNNKNETQKYCDIKEENTVKEASSFHCVDEIHLGLKDQTLSGKLTTTNEANNILGSKPPETNINVKDTGSLVNTTEYFVSGETDEKCDTQFDSYSEDSCNSTTGILSPENKELLHEDNKYEPEIIITNAEGHAKAVASNNVKKYKAQKKIQSGVAKGDLVSTVIRKNSIKVEKEESQCKYCKKPYSSMKYLMRHEKNHIEHKSTNLKENVQADTSKTIIKCSCCKAVFHDKDECIAHQHNIHSDILTCHDCDKIFANPDSLRSHQNIFHKGLPRKVYLYVCEKCGRQFKQRMMLKHHEENNCGTGPLFQCQVCQKQFSSIHTRRSHMRVHDPEKKLLCKFCGKSFHWKGQLKIHERSHTGEKPFTCLYCPKAFAYRESLITHSSLHTGIKPHLCEACGCRFSCIGNLLKHRTTHASTCGLWYNKTQK